MAESSVSTIASSPSVVDTAYAAATIACRTSALALRRAFHSGDSTTIAILGRDGRRRPRRARFLRAAGFIAVSRQREASRRAGSFLALARPQRLERGLIVGIDDAG